MNSKKTPKRAYNSSRRQEQASQTRFQIIEAARRLFIERGYAGATLDAIAQEAGVAVETVYASFGNKKGDPIQTKLMYRLWETTSRFPFWERQGPQTVQHETDQRRQIELFVNDIYEIMGRMAPIFDIMRVAAKTELEISKMLQNMLNSRLQGMMTFVSALMKNGPLRGRSHT